MSEAPTVLYLRESVDDLQGIDRHRVACRALCSARGWPVAREYVDNDRSAIKGTRPAYQQMLADIRAGRVGRIVAWDLDRL